MNQSIFNQMKKSKEKVKALLTEFPHLQDDDYKLIATFYCWEVGGISKAQNKSAYELLQDIADGRLTNTETIRRIRAKLQEQYPSLRGTNYSARQKEGDSVTKKINEL